MGIRKIRYLKGMNQKELANKVGISTGLLSKYERGLLIPSNEITFRISSVLDCPIKNLQISDKKNGCKVGEGYVTSVPLNEFIVPPINKNTSKKPQILDLFCGSGGLSHGFELTDNFIVTGGIDLLPDRIKTFSENHPYAISVCKDIHNLNCKDTFGSDFYPDIIIGGPPCQGFSSIRPFRSMINDDSRNNLFVNFSDILDHYNPDWFVFENVVGLLTHNGGSTFNDIIKNFQRKGYQTKWKILNMVFYGLPQRRERLIVVGGKKIRQFEFPEPTHYFLGKNRSMANKKYAQIINQETLLNGKLKPAVTIMEAIHDLPEIASGESGDRYRQNIELTEYEKRMQSKNKQLTLHYATKHSEKMLEIIKNSGFNRSALPKGLTNSGFSTCYSRLEPDKPSVTITVNFVHPSSNKCIHPYQNRALTPREGARIQGFEDDFIFVGNKAQIVKQIGNAVPPIFGEIIGNSLLNVI